MAWCEANRVEVLAGTSEKRASEGGDRAGDGRGESTVPTDRTRRPVVQRVRLPDTGELELCAPVVAKAEHLGKRREPAIRGDVSE